MLASERRVTQTPGANGINALATKHPGVTQILKPGRAVKIYVIDPRKFQERLEKYVGDLKNTGRNNSSKDGHTKETKLPSERKDIHIKSLNQLPFKKGNHINTGTNTAASSNGIYNIDPNTGANPEGLKAEFKPKRLPPKRKAKKRKVVGAKKPRKESISSEEKDGAAELAFLMKETTTRLGRVSKSSTAVAAAASQPASPVGSVFSSVSSGPNSAVPSPSPSVTSVNSQGKKIKKREPPEMFRCQTCRKVYLGHTKFNLHFQKFPEHQRTSLEVRDLSVSIPKILQTQPQNLQLAQTRDKIKNYSGQINYSSISNITIPTSFLTNGNHNCDSPTDSILDELANSPSNNQDQIDNESANSHNQFLEGLTVITTRTTFGPTANRRITPINPDTLSDNCSSPKLPDYNSASSEVQTASERIYNSSEMEMDPVFLQVSSPLLRQSQNGEDDHDLQPITVPDLCIPSMEEEGSNSSINGRSEYFNFQSDFNPLPEISQIPSELIGNGSCSQQSFNMNSLDNLLADSNSHSPIIFSKSSPSPSPPLRLHSRNTNISNKSKKANAEPLIPSSCASSGSNFFSSEGTKGITAIQNSSSIEITSSFNSNNNNHTNNGGGGGNIRSSPVDDDSRDVCINGSEDSHHGTENSLDGCEIQTQSSPTALAAMIKRKSIWEFVKEQIRMCGINQACGEISEMAEKLSKVARDKFYPIREEEIERLGGTPPIIQVETPFISHLLDLPFGTYIFKEDGGIRKIIPPPTPVSSDLSLTGGVEVDIDKFLSPDIDLISLPHLTNLDFAAICNE